MTNPAGVALLDTNILLYAAYTQNPYHRPAKQLVDRGREGSIPVCVTPQVFNEFFSVSTRTDKLGLEKPLPADEAQGLIQHYIDADHVRIIYPTPGVWPRMRTLLHVHPVKGPQIYDVQLAATMLENGVSKIYTYNRPHFSRVEGIEVLMPEPVEK